MTPLSKIAFKFNLRRYIKVSGGKAMYDGKTLTCGGAGACSAEPGVPDGRDLHSSTSQLNLSCF